MYLQQDGLEMEMLTLGSGKRNVCEGGRRGERTLLGVAWVRLLLGGRDGIRHSWHGWPCSAAVVWLLRGLAASWRRAGSKVLLQLAFRRESSWLWSGDPGISSPACPGNVTARARVSAGAWPR